MIRKALIALSALAIAMPALAAGDPPLGSRLGNRTQKAANSAYDNYEMVRTGHLLAQCFYARRKPSVLALLNAESADAAARASRSLRSVSDCSLIMMSTPRVEGVSVQMPEDIRRGMFAEAALRDIASVDTIAPVSTETSYVRSWFVVTGRVPAVDEMAVCTAAQNPDGIRALLATKPETPEELKAAQSLAPTLGPCLPQGATLKANRQSLRAALAEALFHRAVAPMTVTVQ